MSEWNKQPIRPAGLQGNCPLPKQRQDSNSRPALPCRPRQSSDHPSAVYLLSIELHMRAQRWLAAVQVQRTVSPLIKHRMMHIAMLSSQWVY
jgi:hypothetical protein